MFGKSGMRYILALIILSLMVLTFGCGGSQTDSGQTQEPETLKIGMIVPWTGPLGTMGSQAKNGALLAEKQINENGGFEVNGKKYNLEIVAYDDATVPENAVSVTQKLINEDQVKLIFGALSSGSTLAVQPITEANNVLLVTISTAKQLIGPDKKLTIRANYVTEQAIKMVLPFYAEELNLKNVAIIGRNDAWGLECIDLAKAEFAKQGINIISTEVVDGGTTDYNTPITKIKATKPDGILMVLYPEEAGLFVKQAREMGLNATTFGFGQPISGTAFYELGGKAVAGHLDWDSMAGFRKEDLVTKYFEEYKNEYGMEAQGTAITYYDIINMIVEAMKNAGTVDDPQAIRDSFVKLEYPGVSMPVYRFLEDGQLLPQAAVARMDEQGKKTGLAILSLNSDGSASFEKIQE